MHFYQHTHLNIINPHTIILHELTIDRLNAILTYIEFFKSAMTNNELLTAIQDQMNKYSITKAFISTLNYNPNLTFGPVTLASVKLYEIINELESKCNTDHINLNI